MGLFDKFRSGTKLFQIQSASQSGSVVTINDEVDYFILTATGSAIQTIQGVTAKPGRMIVLWTLEGGTNALYQLTTPVAAWKLAFVGVNKTITAMNCIAFVQGNSGEWKFFKN